MPTLTQKKKLNKAARALRGQVRKARAVFLWVNGANCSVRLTKKEALHLAAESAELLSAGSAGEGRTLFLSAVPF